MHFTPLGLYTALLVILPLTLIAKAMEHIHVRGHLTRVEEWGWAAFAAVGIFAIWILMLWLGVKVYEKHT
jgi:hypothetical protein